ncbi:PACE efflux transporter [Photobacterium damselae]|uniref:Transporter n=3 Tax=Photobacterium damselae TaxID=38293 RepID=A0ABD6X6W5_PHODM|nr:PACE efflux transporter [Photobacterium damselae]ARR51530.1 transporter [Photobacterium damselae subsp. damselae]KAB1182226.1 PACE efflux transporter [Photobacterium damselae subsp. damselae]KAB1182664.1 PACE efflux transporter [Photobacterium damselae subsp. damselae]MBF7101412.1 PACE efflux transporter [Photobacterium damselae]MCG3816024.1 PACE efflux transporter [Photobacterium damselae]
MRTRAQRIGHAIGFEVIGLILIVGVLSQFGFDQSHSGMMAIVVTIVATFWNYAYNVLFDNYLKRKYGSIHKTQKMRLVHTVLFEAGLLVVTTPIVAVMMDLNLWDAFLLDVGMALFYLVYAYIYNWIFDKLFPPQVAI